MEQLNTAQLKRIRAKAEALAARPELHNTTNLERARIERYAIGVANAISVVLEACFCKPEMLNGLERQIESLTKQAELTEKIEAMEVQ